MNPGIRRYLIIAASFVGIILFFRYLLPLLLPFLLGAGLAVAADPLVNFLCNRFHFRRSLATGISISMAFSFLTMVLMMLCGLVLRELRNLAGYLPELESTLLSGMEAADLWLLDLAGRVPGELGILLQQNAGKLRSSGDALLGRTGDFLLKLASGIVTHAPGSALSIGTGIIASFMISAKLPQIRQWLRSKLSGAQILPVVSSLSRLKTALVGWLKAQAKLSFVTFLIAALGFLLLRVPRWLLWALVVALVDAFPILGTGTVLVPWSLFSFLQGDHVLAFGLLGLYGAGALIRSVLEPRFLGKHLGLDPLVTLVALYAGFRLWGIGGMILAPMLTVAATQLIQPAEN